MYESGYNGQNFATDTTESDFAYRYTVTGDADMTLRSSMFLGSATGQIQPQNEYIVAWLTAGEGVMDIGADEVEFEIGRPTMFPTGKLFAFDMQDYRQNLIHFRAGYLEQIAVEHEGVLAGPIHFNHQAVPDGRSLLRWRRAVSQVAKTVLGPSPPSLLMQSEIKRLAAVTLLDTFSHESIGVAPALRDPRHARLREAVEYLHANARLPVSTSDVAEAVGMTPRGLQQAFSRQLEMTPTEYLRLLRLEHVHAELLALHPDDATVSEVATRWGFLHLGRFAAAYAGKFGEKPSETLRR